MSSKCPHCGCTKIEIEPARGDAVCTSCGTVLSEHNIVSEVQFLDNAKGGSSAVGQFVSSDSINKRSGFSRSFTGVFSKDSKEITLTKARKNIRGLSQRLRLNDHCIETAFNFFKLALSKGMTKGRKSELIVGACVYMTCRTECTAHMLIDVSDALHVDVYELGRGYLRLSTALCINIPAIDPCLYIWRFAHKLSFGENTHEVSETALRLVKRMKKDWMHTGRRPSGICGAALIMAARFHNFNRSICDVIDVVKVHETTLRKRLTEFGETPSSALTLEEFMNTDLEEEQDPPAFKKAKNKDQDRVKKLIDDADAYDTEFIELQQEIEKQLGETKKKLRGKWAKYEKENSKEDLYMSKFIAESTMDTINEVLNETEKTAENLQPNKGLGPSAASLGIKDSIEDCMKIRPSTPKDSDSGILDLTGIDDAEIDSYIMSEREIQFKTQIWLETNKEYLEELKLKEEKEKEEEEQRLKEGKPAKKKKAYVKRNKSSTPANTAGEAIEKMLQEKKLSNKINYDVLKNLNSEEDTESSGIGLNPGSVSSSNSIRESNEPLEELNSIVTSLTGKSDVQTDVRNDKRPCEDQDSYEEEEGYEEGDDGDEEEEVEQEESLSELLRKRRGEEDNFYDDEEYD